LDAFRARVYLSGMNPMRRLAPRRGYALTSVATLALGIGANLAIFSVLNALLLRPLPYPDPERLYVLGASFAAPGDPPQGFAAGPLDFVRWRERARSFARTAAWTPRDMAFTGDGPPESVLAAAVSAELFPLLGAEAQLGRVFSGDEDRPGSGVVVLSDGLWRRRFGGDPAVVGRTVRLDGEPRVVVGIMKQGFAPLLQPGELWIPLGLDAASVRPSASRQLLVAARLAPGVTPAQALSELQGVNRQVRAESPDTHMGWDVTVQPLRGYLFGARRPWLLLLAGSAGLVLLIACTNLGNLALAQAITRRGDVALRLALGASRRRIVAEQLAETGLIAATGGLIGLVVAYRCVGPLLALDAEVARQVGPVPLDWRVAAFAVGVVAFAALGVGLLPALRQAGTDPGDALKSGSGRSSESRSDHRLREILVAAQVSLCVMLLAGASVLLGSLSHDRRQSPGFDARGLLAMQIVPSVARYSEAARRVQLVEQVLERVRGLPGVTGATTTMTRFRPGISMQTGIVPEGHESVPGEEVAVHMRRVSPGYCRTLGVPLEAGRELDERDGADAPRVAMLSRSLARRLWPGQDPIGKRIQRRANPPTWLSVVGVVGDVRDTGLGAEPLATLYLPYAQNNVAGVSWSPVTLVVRGPSDPAAIAASVRSAIAAVDPDQPVDAVAPVEQLLRDSLAAERFRTVLLAVFGALGLFLAGLGVNAVTSYSVTRRRREVSIRLALGAPPANLVGTMVATALRPAGLGALAGVAAGWALARSVGRLVPGLAALDLSATTQAVLVLTLTAAVAAYVPARRVTRVEAWRALRAE
jgi:putative ABC transport system permease protein